MGNVSGFRRKKVEPAPRRPPLRSIEEVFNSNEAKTRIIEAMKANMPSTASRWDRIVEETNADIPQTEEEPDPLRLDLDLETIQSILKVFYDGVTSLESDGLTLLREYMPKMYDKHSLERGLKISQKEREARGLSDECFAYGELDYEVFTTIFLKATSVYGLKNEGKFYDLGCGAGLLVYSAAFIGNFRKAIGVDNVGALLQRGEARMSRWDTLKENFTQAIQDVDVEWVEENFLLNPFWKDATFILLHWTAFSTEQRHTISDIMSQCEEGTQVISFTNPIPGNDFVTLVQDACITSWGKAEFYFQEKITKATK